MKTTFLFITLLFLTFYIAAEENQRPKICLNMIVKNESKVIERCLESAKPLIDYWIIVDTGSNDGTQEIIKEFMKDIPGELYERPWINFEHNRNEAMQLANHKADYLLIIDADDKFEVSPDFIWPELDKDGYIMKVNCFETNHYRPHLVRTGLDWHWEGVIHEGLISETQSIGRLDGIKMIIIGGGDRSNDPKKFEKDANLLEIASMNDPTNTRAIFYLAQSYQNAGDLASAIKNYEKRVSMEGWDQEVFWSLYQIAILQERLEMPEDVIAASYARAYSFRPTRAEPLFRLSSYYRRKGNPSLGYLFSLHAKNFKYPEDTLFVESRIYEYAFLLEYSLCAYEVGRYDEAFSSSYQLLCIKNLPENVRECVKNNMSFIIPKVVKEEHTFEVKLYPKCFKSWSDTHFSLETVK